MGDPTTIGTLLLVLLPILIPAIVGFLQAWASRGQGRAVKFRGKIAGQSVEFEGSAEDLQKLLQKLTDESTSNEGK